MGRSSYLSFKIGGEHFAIYAERVVTILKMQHISSVPNSPDFVKGLINLRGNVLTVLDAGLQLDIKNQKLHPTSCIIVVEIDIDNEPEQAGFIVDEVMDVEDLTDDFKTSPPGKGSKFQSEYVTARIQNKDQYIMLLDIDLLLALEPVEA